MGIWQRQGSWEKGLKNILKFRVLFFTVLCTILTLSITLLTDATEAPTFQLALPYRGLLIAAKGKDKTLYSRSAENISPRKRHNWEVSKVKQTLWGTGRGRRVYDASTQKPLYFTDTLTEKPSISRQFAQNKEPILTETLVMLDQKLSSQRLNSALKIPLQMNVSNVSILKEEKTKLHSIPWLYLILISKLDWNQNQARWWGIIECC